MGVGPTNVPPFGLGGVVLSQAVDEEWVKGRERSVRPVADEYSLDLLRAEWLSP